MFTLLFITFLLFILTVWFCHNYTPECLWHQIKKYAKHVSFYKIYDNIKLIRLWYPVWRVLGLTKMESYSCFQDLTARDDLNIIRRRVRNNSTHLTCTLRSIRKNWKSCATSPDPFTFASRTVTIARPLCTYVIVPKAARPSASETRLRERRYVIYSLPFLYRSILPWHNITVIYLLFWNI